VYIIALPFFGVVTEVFAVFSRRPVFGYKTLVFATLAIGGLSVGVWAHHMFATGVVALSFFSLMSLLIAVPTGIKFFNWIGTMWGGHIWLATPMLFAIGMLLVFLLGGLSGVLQAMAPVDFSLTDTYFIVAHMHYVIMGLVMGAFAGTYYWFPKMTGKRLSERWGKVHFWCFFVGINVTFFVQHQLGLDGMPRRVASYTQKEGWGTLNLISTIGSYILALGVLAFAWILGFKEVTEPLAYGAWGEADRVGIFFGSVVVACLGGPLLGIAAARWLRFPGAVVALVIGVLVVVLTGEGLADAHPQARWAAFIRLGAPWAQFTTVNSDDRQIGSWLGSPWLWVGWLVALCVLAFLGALLKGAEGEQRQRLFYMGLVTGLVGLVLLGLATFMGPDEALLHTPSGVTTLTGGAVSG
jgi:hypothetical protein